MAKKEKKEVEIEVIKDTKHLKKGAKYEVSKDVADILIKKKEAKLIK